MNYRIVPSDEFKKNWLNYNTLGKKAEKNFMERVDDWYWKVKASNNRKVDAT